MFDNQTSHILSVGLKNNALRMEQYLYDLPLKIHTSYDPAYRNACMYKPGKINYMFIVAVLLIFPN